MKQKKKTNKKMKRYARSAFKLFAIAIIAFCGFQVYGDVSTTMQLRAEKQEAEQIVLSLASQKEILSEEIQKLEDPEYVKRYARGKYMVTKDGEQVFKLPSKEE
ncbi:MAG: FtsB family cell division protein [Erysipelotrichaceae bacterium]